MSNTEQKITKLVDGTTPTIEATVRQVGSEGALVVSSGGGTLVSEDYDYIAATYPDGSTEVFTYKSGGSGGSTVAVITIVYTDTTKKTISTITRT